MRKARGIALAVLAAVLIAGCSHHGSSQATSGSDGPSLSDTPAVVLMRFDANHDGLLTRPELTAGLKRDFAAADTNRDGVLQPDEVRAVNERRWNIDGEAASMLIDWNRDGVVDFNEFATTDFSLLEKFDANGDGVLSPRDFVEKKKRDTL